jgi:HAD superfamily hydrolase (TIGR01509 family)
MRPSELADVHRCFLCPERWPRTLSNVVQAVKPRGAFRVKLKLPEGDFRAYLFDCDGTIADSMPLHYIAWKAALGEWNCEFDEGLFYRWGGRPVKEIIAALNERDGLKMPVESVADRREYLYYCLLPQLKAVPEVLEHIDAQHGRIPFAVVSGSGRQSVIKSLSTLELLDKFDVIVGAEDYKRSKPAPDAFLLAAEKLGVQPTNCLVFEDTELGIQSATAAGIPSVRVPSPLERRRGSQVIAQGNPSAI